MNGMNSFPQESDFFGIFCQTEQEVKMYFGKIFYNVFLLFIIYSKFYEYEYRNKTVQSLTTQDNFQMLHETIDIYLLDF